MYKELIAKALENTEEFPMTLANRVRRKGGIEKMTEEDARKLCEQFRLIKEEPDAYHKLKDACESVKTLCHMRGELNEGHTWGYNYDEHQYDAEIAEGLKKISELKEAGMKSAQTYGRYIYEQIRAEVSHLERGALK